MIQTKLFQRHYAITAIVILFFILLGFLISNAVMRFVMTHQAFPGGPGPDAFFARLIDEINPGNRVQALQHIEQMSNHSFPFRFSILDAGGKNLSNEKNLMLSWSEIKKPTAPYQFEAMKTENPNDGPLGHPLIPDGLIRFSGEPAQYLYVSHNSPAGLPHGPSPAGFFFATFGSLILSILTGVGFALALLFRSMRAKMALADSVISDLKSGNLKARFPIGRMDELGQAMSRFNKMADEIERLVERLRAVEKSRMVLLQDLTHDLRTPVASLKNLLSTIEKKGATEDQAIRSELLSLAQREVDYFEKLVEDLLVLAQVIEPRYQSNQNLVSLLEIVEDESESVSAQSSTAESLDSDSKNAKEPKRIKVETSISPSDCQVAGDVHLLRRLFRNAFENAYSFAKSEVIVSIGSANSSELKILIQDDGPGLSATAIKGFGERKSTRSLERSNGNRISIGLGSVIMKTVADIHGGSMNARNRCGPSGEVIGAEIQITLPKSGIFLSKKGSAV